MKCLIRASHENIITITNGSDHILLYWHSTAVARRHTKVKSSVTRILNDFRPMDRCTMCSDITNNYMTI